MLLAGVDLNGRMMIQFQSSVTQSKGKLITINLHTPSKRFTHSITINLHTQLELTSSTKCYMFTVCFNVDTGRSEMDLSKKSQFILLDFLVKRATLRTLIH